MKRHHRGGGPAETQLLAASKDFALLALCVDDLPYSVLVQLSALRFGGNRAFSLYSVYREGSMTFDAIVGFDGIDPDCELPALLSRFVQGRGYRDSVLAPLVKTVHRHFRRRESRLCR